MLLKINGIFLTFTQDLGFDSIRRVAVRRSLCLSVSVFMSKKSEHVGLYGAECTPLDPPARAAG